MKKSKGIVALLVGCTACMVLALLLLAIEGNAYILDGFHNFPEALPVRPLYLLWFVVTCSLAGVAIVSFMIFLATVLNPTDVTYRAALTFGWVNIAMAVESFIAFCAFAFMTNLMHLMLLVGTGLMLVYLVLSGLIGLRYAAIMKKRIHGAKLPM